MSNPYSLLLKKYIQKSGLSLSEIESEMRKRGLNKNKAYLSSLQNGRMDPPPFNVTNALCEIIGGDPIRLSLTGIFMEISQENFFPIITDTVTTMIATLIDINKNKISGPVSNFFNGIGIEMNAEELLTYESVKEILNEVVEELPFNDIFQKAAREVLDLQIEEIEDIVQSAKNPRENKKQNEINQEEANYLIECLEIYRKLKLKPVK